MKFKTFKPVLRLLVLALIIGFVFSTEACHNRLFLFPDQEIRYTPKVQYEEVSFLNSNGNRLTGWYLPAENPIGAVVLNHGNSGNIALYLDYIEFFTLAGVNLLLYDYQGFGTSEGSPSVRSLVDDALAAFDYLESRENVPIAVMGVSLGTPLSCRVVVERPQAKGLILEGAFLPAELIHNRMGAIGRPLAWIITRTIYLTDPVEDVRRLGGRPLLMVHGTEDPTTPFDGAKRLYEHARTYAHPDAAWFWVVEEARHFPEISFHHPTEYRSLLKDFLHTVFLGKSSAAE